MSIFDALWTMALFLTNLPIFQVELLLISGILVREFYTYIISQIF
jgi:hypothetical protein